MRAPLRFQELQREVEAWCQEHGDASCKVEFTNDDDEVPAFRVEALGRELHFRLIKGWPPIIEARRNDIQDPEKCFKLIKVNQDNSWNPPPQALLEPWHDGRPF